MCLDDELRDNEMGAKNNFESQLLASRILAAGLEGLKQICDYSFAHALQRMERYNLVTASDADRQHFYLLCTQGHRIAQAHLIERFLLLDEIRSELEQMQSDSSVRQDKEQRLAIGQAFKAVKYWEDTMHMIANGIAWTLLGGEPWVLRRLYLGNPQIPLASSNLKCALRFIRKYESSPLRFGFLTDLTSCIQMGDIILVDHSKGFGWHQIAELKEGNRVLDILDSIAAVNRGQYQEHHRGAIAGLSNKDIEQTHRTIRQIDRMVKTSEILCTDRGIDPVSGSKFHLVDSDLCLRTYDAEMTAILCNVSEVGKEIRFVENCIWIGAFDLTRVPNALSEFEKHVVSSELYVAKTESARSKRDKFRPVSLCQAVEVPQVSPLFRRKVPSEFILKILRRNWAVFFHLDFERLFIELNRRGIFARWQRKEERRLHPPDGAFTQFGSNPVIEKDGQVAMVVGDIAIVRLLFEGWTVETLAKWYEHMLNYRGIILPT